MIVLANAVPGREDELDRWYAEDHIASVLDVAGFARVRRFRRSTSTFGDECPYALAVIYEIEAPDIGGPMGALAAARAEMSSTDALADRAVWLFEHLDQFPP